MKHYFSVFVHIWMPLFILLLAGLLALIVLHIFGMTVTLVVVFLLILLGLPYVLMRLENTVVQGDKRKE